MSIALIVGVVVLFFIVLYVWKVSTSTEHFKNDSCRQYKRQKDCPSISCRWKRPNIFEKKRCVRR